MEYVRYIASLISKKVLKNGMVLECVTDIFSISIMIEGKKLLSISIEDVEKFRQSGVLVFDKFIINILHFANISIDETSSYYERVNQVIF